MGLIWDPRVASGRTYVLGGGGSVKSTQFLHFTRSGLWTCDWWGSCGLPHDFHDMHLGIIWT